MNLSQLYYFQHLAEVQQYTRAAEDLFVTQSALSHSIASLEDELGCTLFEKDGRSLHLTEDGRLLKKSVDPALASIDGCVAEIKSRHGLLSGTIDIGAIASVRSSFLPAAITAFRNAQGPLVECRVIQGETMSLATKLDHGACDLIIAGPINARGVTTRVLFRQQLAVVVPRSHPLAHLEKIHFADLLGYDVITYRRGIPIGETLCRFLQEHWDDTVGLRLIRNYEDEVILGAMAMHEGVVALSLVTPSLLPEPDMVVIPLDEQGAQDFFPVELAYRTKGFHSGPSQNFISFLEGFEAPPFVHPCLRDDAKSPRPSE